jgi:hypothetical protein
MLCDGARLWTTPSQILRGARGTGTIPKSLTVKASYDGGQTRSSVVGRGRRFRGRAATGQRPSGFVVCQGGSMTAACFPVVWTAMITVSGQQTSCRERN